MTKKTIFLSLFFSLFQIQLSIAGGHEKIPNLFTSHTIHLRSSNNAGLSNTINSTLSNLGQQNPAENYEQIRSLAEGYRQSAEASEAKIQKVNHFRQNFELEKRESVLDKKLSQERTAALNLSVEERIRLALAKNTQTGIQSQSLSSSNKPSVYQSNVSSRPHASEVSRPQPTQVAHQTQSEDKVKARADEEVKQGEPAFPGLGSFQGSYQGTGSSSNNHECFPAGTLVWVSETPDQLKSIESLEPGDKVWSCNLSINQCVVRTIVKTFKTETKQLVSVQGLNQRGMEVTFKTTPNHPFYKENEELPSLAKDLKKGDSLKTSGEDTFSLTQDAEVEELENPTPVFNFQVDAEEGNNNYYIGTPLLCGNALILVHNCGTSGAAAVANASGIACVTSTATCVIGVGASIAEAGLALSTGGAAAIAMPALVVGTETACQAALASCSLAAGAETVNMLSQGGGDFNRVDRIQRNKGHRDNEDKQKKGTPGSNQAQNAQVRDVSKQLKLNEDQIDTLHDLISGENKSFKEILEIAKEIKYNGLR